jgi:hypothetical protein
MVVANNLHETVRHGQGAVAMMEKIPTLGRAGLRREFPTPIVVPGDEHDGDGRSPEKGLGVRGAFRCMDDVAEPNHAGRRVVCDQGIQSRFQFIVTPARQQIAPRTVTLCVPPMQIGEQQESFRCDPDR